MREQLEQELEKIGLAEKEAKVYLAALELGPSTAQSIAAKATVNRPTTYIMIESLIKRGLMSSFEKGKKRYFEAAKPAKLLFVISSKKRVLEEQEKRLNELLPFFSNFSSKIRSTVEIYEGPEATHIVQDLLLNNREEVLELVPLDIVSKYVPPIFKGDIREKYTELFPIKSLVSSNKRHEVEKNKRKNLSTLFLEPNQFPFSAEVLIFGSKVIFLSFDEKQTAIIVNDKNIAVTMKVLYMALWDKAQKNI